MTKLNEGLVVNALACRHAKDVFVPGCKTGATWLRSKEYPLQIMDAWAMNRSWANPAVTCYEVKCSKSDFMGDKKWRGYLPYCNEFYFATPWKMVFPEELPGAECGLVWVTENGSRCVTKRRAQYREVDIPESLWRYILMCRTRIDAEIDPGDRGANRAEQAKTLLAKKAEWSEIGHLFARHIREQADKVEIENHRLKKEMERCDEVKAILKELGVESALHLTQWNLREDIIHHLEALEAEWPKVERPLNDFLNDFKVVQQAIKRAREDREKALAAKVVSP